MTIKHAALRLIIALGPFACLATAFASDHASAADHWRQLAESWPSGPQSDFDSLPEPPIEMEPIRIGKYQLERWRSPWEGEGVFSSPEEHSYGMLLRLTGPGGEVYQVRQHQIYHGDEGRDITGNGIPNLVLLTWTGGNRCCTGVHVLELGEHLQAVFVLPAGMYPFRMDFGNALEDLDEDGQPELLGWDVGHTYAYGCAGADSAVPRVVFTYRDQLGYVLATDEYYEKLIGRREHWGIQSLDMDVVRPWLETEARRQDPTGWSCDVVNVVLDLYYGGRKEEAWAIFEEYYPAEGTEGRRRKALLRQGLMTSLRSNPLAVP